MSSTGNMDIYNDFKRLLKITIKIAASSIIIAVIVSGVHLAYSFFQDQSHEKEILSKALPFTKTHKPWTYSRNDFGKESWLELWFLGDTDSHAIIKVSGKYSVYSTTTSNNGVINFYKKAGDVCDYASAAVDDGKISWVACDSDNYKDGPWNVVK